MAGFPRIFEPANLDWGPDPDLIRKFINCLMRRGKKATAERLLRGALNTIKKRIPHADPLEVLTDAIVFLKPTVEVRSKRVGGTTYQIPMQVYETRQQSLSIRWIIHAACGKSGYPTTRRLADEILAARWRVGPSR
jgi:small subunit ribosomal protein S7